MHLKRSRNSADFKRTPYVVRRLRVNGDNKKWSKGQITTEIHKKMRLYDEIFGKIPIWGNVSLFFAKLATH